MKTKIFIKSNWLTLVFLTLGTAFLVLGIVRKEYIIVMEKAINICLECVGIG
ncbi:MAG: CD1871A family CXXC motif-containing protein [Anaerovoracaceae bacterium]